MCACKETTSFSAERNVGCLKHVLYAPRVIERRNGQADNLANSSHGCYVATNLLTDVPNLAADVNHTPGESSFAILEDSSLHMSDDEV